MQKIDLISDEQSLIGATNRFGHAIEVYDDGFGPLWIHRHSIGISGIVRARTWEDAYSICEDELIYAKDLNGDFLDRLTPELLSRLEISLQIETIS